MKWNIQITIKTMFTSVYLENHNFHFALSTSVCDEFGREKKGILQTKLWESRKLWKVSVENQCKLLSDSRFSCAAVLLGLLQEHSIFLWFVVVGGGFLLVFLIWKDKRHFEGNLSRQDIILLFSAPLGLHSKGTSNCRWLHSSKFCNAAKIHSI